MSRTQTSESESGVYEAGSAGTLLSKVKPKLLVVPHIYADDIRVRSVELARRLTNRFDVYCMKWSDALHVNCSSRWCGRWKQIQKGTHALVARRTVERGSDGVMYVRSPILQPVLIRRLIGSKQAWSVSQAFNSRMLIRTMRLLNITHLLLASGLFKVPTRHGIRSFFDLVDWFEEERAPAWQLARHRAQLSHIREHATAVFGVSEPLCEMLKANYDIEAIPLPNGADLTALRTVPSEKVADVRRRWGINGKFVLGYIGNHGSFTGVDFLLLVFQRLRWRISNSALLIVGPADYWKPYAAKIPGGDVIFTDPVDPSEMPAYFNALDIGVLAQGRSLGTDFAFQIKVVEYTACRKFVISTPLLVWQRLKWPNIVLVERHPESWVEAIMKLREARWQPEWDRIPEPYDWHVLTDQLSDFMLNDESHRGNPI